MKNSNLLSREEMKSLFGGQSAAFSCTSTYEDMSCSSSNGDCKHMYCVVDSVLHKCGVCCDRIEQTATGVICAGELKCLSVASV